MIPRRHSAALDECTYLNQASLGLIPRGSNDAMVAFLTDVAQHGNIRLSDDDETCVLDELRVAGARVLGTSLETVAVVSGASEGLNHAASMLASQDGQVVLVTTDFSCVTSPWLNAHERLGTQIRWVDDRPETDLTADIVDAIVDDVDRRLRQCRAVRHGHPHRRGGGDSTSSRSRRVGDRRCDADGRRRSRFDGRVAGRRRRVQRVQVVVGPWLARRCSPCRSPSSRVPPMLGWMGTVDPFDFDAQHLQLAHDARRFQMSTMAYSSAIGLTKSLELLERTGVENIALQAHDLSEELITESTRLGWRPFRPHPPTGASRHIVSLRHDDHDAAAVQRILAKAH